MMYVAPDPFLAHTYVPDTGCYMMPQVFYTGISAAAPIAGSEMYVDQLPDSMPAIEEADQNVAAGGKLTYASVLLQKSLKRRAPMSATLRRRLLLGCRAHAALPVETRATAQSLIATQSVTEHCAAIAAAKLAAQAISAQSSSAPIATAAPQRTPTKAEGSRVLPQLPVQYVRHEPVRAEWNSLLTSLCLENFQHRQMQQRCAVSATHSPTEGADLAQQSAVATVSMEASEDAGEFDNSQDAALMVAPQLEAACEETKQAGLQKELYDDEDKSSTSAGGEDELPTSAVTEDELEIEQRNGMGAEIVVDEVTKSDGGGEVTKTEEALEKVSKSGGGEEGGKGAESPAAELTERPDLVEQGLSWRLAHSDEQPSRGSRAPRTRPRALDRLAKTENAYRVRGGQLSALEELKRRVQSLLNKICPENATSIARQLAQANLQDASDLELVIKLIFEKALHEAHYCETYGDLALALKSELPSFENGNSKPITFKTVLLNYCQHEFDALPTAIDLDESMIVGLGAEDIDVLMKKRKQRALANMRFIGHLYLRQLLSTKVITSVAQELAGCGADTLPKEHVIECLVELLMTTGVTLEAHPVGALAVSQVCDRIKDLQKRKGSNGKSFYSKRLQFMVQDLIESRAAGWRKKVFTSAAMTKDEIKTQMETQKGPGAGIEIVAGQRPGHLAQDKGEWSVVKLRRG